MLKTNNRQTHWSYCRPSLVSVAPLFSTSHGTRSSQLLSCLLSRVAFGECCADTVPHTAPRTPSKPSAGAKGVPAVVSQHLGIRQPPELGTRAAARTGHPRPSPGRSPPRAPGEARRVTRPPPGSPPALAPGRPPPRETRRRVPGGAWSTVGCGSRAASPGAAGAPGRARPR